MRTIDELCESALAIIDRAYCMGAYRMRPLFSGGHDSLCATHLASQHRGFQHDVHHIKTGIGAKYTREYVERVCRDNKWNLIVWESPATYQKLIEKQGFPGPGAHAWAYNWLKDRCVGYMSRGCRAGYNAAMLVTGCRSEESVRRMGHVAPIKVGEWSEKKQRWTKMNRVWVAPCHDWTKAEQQHYMSEMGLPVNRLKVALGMSGECFCWAFAQPGELDAIREHAPDVALEIDRLTVIAKECGKPCRWGERPADTVEVAGTGPLCSSCDQRAAAAGYVTITN